MKNFAQVVEEVKAGVRQKSFSIHDYGKMFAALVNDSEYKYNDLSFTADGLVKEEHIPYAEFRAFVAKLVKQMKTGLTQEEIDAAVEHIMVSPKDVQFFHSLMGELMYQYMGTGRKMHLFNREDITASIKVRGKDGGPKEIKTKRDGKTSSVKIMTKPHNVLSQSSGCPPWLCEKI